MNHPSEPNLYRARSVISQLRACYIMRLEQLRNDSRDAEHDGAIRDISQRISRLSAASIVLTDNVMGERSLHVWKMLQTEGLTPPEAGFKGEREWHDLVDVKPTELEPT